MAHAAFGYEGETMAITPLSSDEKRILARKVGRDLVATHGKKQRYSVDEVKAAARRQEIPPDWDCWALSLYTRRREFDTHHRASGQPCDYAVMRKEMVDTVSTDAGVPADGLGDLDIHGVDTDTESSWFSDFLDGLDFDVD
jgi:hypothetical protein